MKSLNFFLTILLALLVCPYVVFGENNSASEWSSIGFNSNEAYLWSDSGFTPDEAQQWVKANIDCSFAALLWKQNNFTIEEAKEWSAVGIEPDDALELFELGINIDSYKKWMELGVNNYTIFELSQAGFDYRTAERWHHTGIQPHEWLQFKKNGITLEEATRWGQIGVTEIYFIKNFLQNGIDLILAEQWYRIGIPSSDWLRFKEDNIGLEDATQWGQVGIVSIFEIQDFLQAGIDLPSAKKWHDSGARPDEWIHWIRAGIGPEEAKDWIATGKRNYADAYDFKKAGINAAEAVEWKKNGIETADEIQKLKDIGVSNPTEKKGWENIKVENIDAWIRSGLTLHDAEQWVSNGFTSLSEIIDWESKGVFPVDATKQKTDKKQKAEIKKNSLKVVFYVLSILIIIGFYLGITDKAVFYMDNQDMFMSFIPYILLMGAFLAGGVVGEDWVIYLGCIASLVMVVVIVYKSFVYNKNFFYAITTAVAKLFLSFLCIFNFTQIISPSGRSFSERRYNRSTAFILMALLSPLLYRLINGERVFPKINK